MSAGHSTLCPCLRIYIKKSTPILTGCPTYIDWVHTYLSAILPELYHFYIEITNSIKKTKSPPRLKRIDYVRTSQNIVWTIYSISSDSCLSQKGLFHLNLQQPQLQSKSSSLYAVLEFDSGAESHISSCDNFYRRMGSLADPGQLGIHGAVSTPDEHQPRSWPATPFTGGSRPLESLSSYFCP